MYKRITLIMIVVFSVGVLLGYGREVLAVRLPEERVRLSSAPILTNSAVPMQELVKWTAADAAAGDEMGFGIATNGTVVAVGARYADGITGNTGAVYIYDTAVPWPQIKKVYAADGLSGDEFGVYLALQEDVLVIGARLADSQVVNSGAVYIFYRDHGGPNNWGQVAKLVASDAANNDQFGRRVAISDDVVVVGAHWDDDNGFNSGSAYVFERNAGGNNNWGQTAKLTASDGAFDEGFGAGIAIFEDTIVVGAVRDGSGEQGAAYVFMRDVNTPTNWLETAKLTASDATPNSYLGGAIDLNGQTLVIGAHRNINYSGAAYVFEPDAQNPGNWLEVKKLTASQPAPNSNFGWELSLVGEQLVVAAPGEAGGQHPGTVYIFSRHAGGPNNWGEIGVLQASDAAAENSFGYSVAASPHVVAIGAYRNDDACPSNPNCNSGAAYLFGTGVDLTIQKQVTPTLTVPGALVTYTLAVQNLLPYTVAQAVITDVVPALIVNPTLVAANIPVTPTGNMPFTWEIGPLPSGVTGVITYTGVISPELVTETTIVNTAVIAHSLDITPTNNSSTAVTQVIIPQINLSASDYVVNEDGGQVMVTAVLSPAQPFLDVTVNYVTSDGTALAGEDYTAVSGILTFTAGTTEAQILVPILDDQLVELDETFSLELSDSAHATLGNIVTTITILDDDAYPELNLSAAEYTVLENAGQAALTVTLSHPYPDPVSVVYETTDDTAVAGDDYTAVSGILTFTAGTTEAQILVPILDDQLVEPDETFSLELSDPVHATLGSIVTTTITILDDDTYPELNLSAADYTVFENDVQVTLTITLSHPYPEPVSVVYETADGTAVAGEDYTAVSGILTFTAGMVQANILVPILDDQLPESAETFTLALSNPVQATLGDVATATITILDDDTYPEINFSPAEYTVLEDEGQVALMVTLSQPYPQLVSVAYETGDGTALAGEDYTAVSGILTFTAGTTEAQILVPILDDQLVEGSETFAVALSSPVNAVLGSVPEAMVLIIDDDSFPLVSLSSEQYVVSENVGGAVFTVTLSHVYPEPVSLVYETADGTAVAGEDYVPVTGTLTFSPGETLATFTSPIIDDELVEPAETFSISLTGFINALPQPPVTAVVTILDNDEELPVSDATIYLPLIMRPASPPPPVEFRVHIGDAIPNRPVVAQGETFYTTVVQIPATLPENGQFYLSTNSNQVTATAVDDQITFALPNGDIVFSYRYSDHGEPVQPHIVPVPRSLVEAMTGQPVTVRYSDVFGFFVSATTIWLIWTP